MQHTPSRYLKVAKPGAVPAPSAARGLHHAHPAFTRFMAEHPRISRFIAEHPKASRFVLRIAHHIPVIETYLPIAVPITPVFDYRARPPRRSPKPRF